LLSFFVLVFVVTWMLWLPVVLLGLPTLVEPYYLPSIGILPGIALGASGVALFMSALLHGKPGVLHLLKGFLLWRVQLRWYLFALLGLLLLMVIVGALLSGSWEPFQALSPAALALYPGAYLSHFYFGPLFEEAAWRGFALPRLQSAYGPLKASLILGVIWGLWHIPVYLLRNIQQAGPADAVLSFAYFLLVTLALTIIFTWLFNNTKGSLLLAVLLHGTADGATTYMHILAAKDIISGASAANIESGLMLGVMGLALILIFATRGHLNYGRYLRTAA
jgi:membrane protease YdiL (CAAX protease family)